jgi:glutamate/tyrosine decarboxylase-like PLP-dependent enzyme
MGGGRGGSVTVPTRPGSFARTIPDAVRDVRRYPSRMTATSPHVPMLDASPFDPATEAEWAALRALGHRMLDDMLDDTATLPDQPAWRVIPDEVREALREPVPHRGVGTETAYRDFVARVLPYPNGNRGPRFFGWVQGNGTPFGMLADMLASGLNPNVGGFDQAPVLVERQTIAWLGELLGMPGAGGLFVSGGSMANTLALAVARFAVARRLGRDVRLQGVQAWPDEPAPRPLVFYGSAEMHSWARKAAELLGLGDRAFRRVPVDAEHRIRLDLLERQIAEDREAGLEPFCVMGTAGTVNIGATDDLRALSAIARREGLWFHVDGAFGALAYLSETLRPRVAGVELADSIGFDLHKWGSLPFDCAVTLVRDAEVQHAAFRTTASYLAPQARGVNAGGPFFAERGVDLSRGFKALKAWMSLRAYGTDAIARAVEMNVAQSERLAQLIASRPELELLAPVPLNIVCYRWRAPGMGETAMNALNEELLLRLQERGIAVPSSTVLDGRFAIRVANVNHRTRVADLEALVEASVAIGAEIARDAAS